MKIRWFKPSDLIGIKKIIKDLHPQWFDKKALKNIPRDVKLHQCIVAEDKDNIIGFITFYSQKRETRLSWIGVKSVLRQKGIGTKLIEKAEKELKVMGVKIIRVETVGETSPQYAPYYETLMFYKAHNFQVEKKSKPKKEKGYKYRMYTLKKIIN